jgi:hypothetical protein
LLKSYSAANFTETLLDCCQKRGKSKETGSATEEAAGVAGYTIELLLEVKVIDFTEAGLLPREDEGTEGY